MIYQRHTIKNRNGRKRYWIELDRKITELYLSGASYRQVKAILDRKMEWDCGLMSLWESFQRIAKKTLSPGLGETLMKFIPK